MSGAIDGILSAVILILGIFGILYMLSDPIKGVGVILFCGVLIFARAFLKKKGLNW